MQTQLESRVMDELKKHRKTSGLSLGEIARLSGIEISVLSRILSGQRQGMSLATAGLLCQYLGLVLGRPVKKEKV